MDQETASLQQGDGGVAGRDTTDRETLEALRLIQHHKLGPWVESHVRAGYAAEEIAARLRDQHYLTVSAFVIRRWIREKLIVTEAVRMNPLVAEYLDDQHNREAVAEQVPHDLQVMNDGIDYLHRVVTGRIPALEGPAVKTGSRVMLKIKAVHTMAVVLKAKWVDVLGEKVKTTKETTSEDRVLEAAREVYGPTARAVPESDLDATDADDR